MGSIPLPALDVKPPQAPQDPLQQIGNLVALRNAMQLQPLKQQVLQQQADSGDLALQQQQQQLNDQKAMTAAMQQWDGKDINTLVPLVVKNGASATAVMGLKQKNLDMEKQYSDIALADAKRGSTNLETMKGKNDLVAGKLSSVLQLPDEQLSQGLTSAAQDLQQQGVLDPQHAQGALQIAQLGDPAKIRTQLQILEKGLMGQTAQMDAALKTAQVGEANSVAEKNNAESDFYKKNGGAPGVPVDAMEMADWLKKNPNKGPSDYQKWVFENSPVARMMTTNLLSNPQDAQALDFVADNYRKTSQIPPDLARSPQTVMAIIRRAAQLDQNAGGAGIAGNKATYQADAGSLKNVQKQFDTVNAFETTAGKNIDMALQKAAAIPDLGAKFLNTPVRMINEKMLGTPEMAEFRTALATAQTEAAKVLNSANANGVLSDSARHELEDITSGNLSLKAMQGQWGVIKQDMQNRHDSYQQQIQAIQGRLKGANGAGSGGMVTMRAPNGQTQQVSADQVEHYKSMGAEVVQ